jgi:1,4-dihydroxy-6-naphthoate synthase
MLLRIGHSPDPDDAFMFYALTHGRVDLGRYRFEHVVEDIESLNRRALRGELEVTALSLHVYAHVADRYALLSCGASMGKGYGPIVVAREAMALEDLRDCRIAVPGMLTTAFLVLALYAGPLSYVEVRFDEVMQYVAKGEADAGLLIHEGQLTFADYGLHKVLDLGRWWLKATGLPLPLGVNAIRRDLGERTLREVPPLLRASIDYALEHREECLQYALAYGRGLDRARADRFVGMYVNEYTRDMGEEGRQAVREVLGAAHRAGLTPAVPPLDFLR